MYLSTIWGRHPRKHDTAKTFQKARLWGQRILVLNRFIFPLDKWIHCPVICLEVLSANKKILKEQRNCIATIPSFGKWSILEMKNLNDSWFSLPKCNWPRLSCLPRTHTGRWRRPSGQGAPQARGTWEEDPDPGPHWLWVAFPGCAFAAPPSPSLNQPCQLMHDPKPPLIPHPNHCPVYF